MFRAPPPKFGELDFRALDAAVEAERTVAEGHRATAPPARAAAPSACPPDGIVLADVLLSADGGDSGTAAGRSNLERAVTGATLRGALRGHQHPIHACSWSPDNVMLVSGSLDDTLKLYGTSPRLSARPRSAVTEAVCTHALGALTGASLRPVAMITRLSCGTWTRVAVQRR